MSTVTNENKSPSVLKAAWIIAVVTIVSKLIGFVRDIIIANYYGAAMVSDAYYYAYQIPSLSLILLGGVGGPFHSATVAIFSKLIPNLQEKPSEHVNKLYSTFMTATIIFFLALSAIMFIFPRQIMGLIISGGSPDMINLAATHLKIMTPLLVIGGIVGIYYGILIIYRQFMLPNLSPIIMSLAIIGVVIAAPSDQKGYALAWATTIGAILQLIIQYPNIRKLGYKLKPNFAFTNNPEFKEICELLFPAVLSSTVGQIHIYVDMFFTSSISEGAWTAIGYANRVFQFPVGILVTAFLVPLFPIFAKLVADKDYNGIKNYFNKGVGVLFFGAIPIIIGILVVGMDAVRLVFERGLFDEKATFMVTEALWFLSVSIIPYVFRDSITRVYYSFNDSKTPFVVAFSSIVLKLVLNYVLISKMHFGIGGITLSTSLVTLFNACVLGMFITKKMDMDYKSLFINLLKMVVAGVITGGICYLCAFEFDKFVHLAKVPFEIIKITFIAIVCMIIYIPLNLLFKMEYAGELFNRLSAKLVRK
ncbi:MAG TPA: murein biosynthesis integral membrane protein MurJ [Cyanobacteria bacterium UBA10660]|nr:MAG TPA: murein biosynthesis integral membrane protein MurJ [Candidatus Gastranaerophilales bacterium HUM_1]HAS94371.1 murein biosynthesis integral membrane protein MurJ [Cyanobacteria bacterium UBA10660]